MRLPATPLDRLTPSPFQRLARLLGDTPPGAPPIDLSIGAPRLGPPAWALTMLRDAAEGWGRYPPNAGTDAYREAVANWLGTRYGPDARRLDLAARVVAVNGTRTALFLLALLVANSRKARRTPIVLLPDPFYHAYQAAAVFAGAEPRFVAVDDDGAPQLDDVREDEWTRVALVYICTPSNPAGATPSLARLRGLLHRVREARALAVFDECYSELWRAGPPAGALEACIAEGPGADGDPLDGAAIVNSLSKRSSAPGLRCGFVCTAKTLAEDLTALIARGGAPVPSPIQAAGAALWRDEEHVAAARAHYNAGFAAAAPVLKTPPAGFFAWTRIEGDDEAFALAAWRDAGVKLVPGRYMSPGAAGRGRVRIAVLDAPDRIAEAVKRLAPLINAHPAQGGSP